MVFKDPKKNLEKAYKFCSTNPLKIKKELERLKLLIFIVAKRKNATKIN